MILSGACEFWVSGKTVIRRPGETIFDHAAQSIRSRYRVPNLAATWSILTPAGFERFFSEMARGGYRIPDDMGTINDIAARFHLSFTGPPL